MVLIFGSLANLVGWNDAGVTRSDGRKCSVEFNERIVRHGSSEMETAAATTRLDMLVASCDSTVHESMSRFQARWH